MIKCEICGREFNDYIGFGGHIRKHKITTQEYYDKYLKKENEEVCIVCGKPTRYINFTRGYQICCSRECAAIIKRKKNKLRKVGDAL